MAVRPIGWLVGGPISASTPTCARHHTQPRLHSDIPNNAGPANSALDRIARAHGGAKAAAGLAPPPGTSSLTASIVNLAKNIIGVRSRGVARWGLLAALCTLSGPQQPPQTTMAPMHPHNHIQHRVVCWPSPRVWLRAPARATCPPTCSWASR